MELNLYQIIGELQVKIFTQEMIINQLRTEISKLKATPLAEVEGLELLST